MSRLGTTVNAWTPADGALLTVTRGPGGAIDPWVPGAWVEVLASAPAHMFIAAIYCHGTSAYHHTEFEFGVGAAGAETPCGKVIGTTYNPTGNGPAVFRPSVPFRVTTAGGHRLAVRINSAGNSLHTQQIRVAYYVDLDAPVATDVLPFALPVPVEGDAASGLASLAPSGADWTWGAYVELTPALPTAAALAGLAVDNVAGGNDEIEVAVGAPGAEVPVATFRRYSGGGIYSNGEHFARLATFIPIAAGARVVARIRRAGTNADAVSVRVALYGAEAAPEPPPEEYEPDPDVDVSGETIGLFWVEFRDKADTLHVWSKVQLPDPATYYGGDKDQRVTKWGRISRALSDRRGEYEGTRFTWTLSDTDRALRGLLAADATKYLLNRSVVIRTISDAARLARQLARTVVRGLVRKYKPVSPLLFEVTAEDILAKHFRSGNDERQIPRRTITRDDFPNAPDEAVGQPVPIIYGEVSDRQLVEQYVPSVLPFGDDIPPCHVFCHDVAGAGTLTGRVWAMVCAVIDGEEGPHSNMAGTYVSAPSQRRLAIFWDEVPGADSYNIYVFNGSPWPDLRGDLHGSTVVRVKTHDNSTSDGLWHGVQVADYRVNFDGWTDGADALAEHLELVDVGRGVVKPTYVGQKTIGGVAYHGWIVAGHAGKSTIELYIDGVAQKIATDASQAGAGGIWLIPGFAGWNAAMGSPVAPYEDINGRRYWPLYGKVGYYGPDRGAGIATDDPGTESAQAETTGLTLNVQGIEDVGDGSGALIRLLLQQYKHFLINWGFGDYQSGAWLEAPAFPADPEPEDEDTIRQIDEASFDAADAVSEARRAEGSPTVGEGYVGGGVLGGEGEFITLRQAIARWTLSCDVYSGFNRRTQFFVVMFSDAAALLTTAREYTQERDIKAASFDVQDLEGELFNARPYAYARRPAEGKWQVEDEVSDAASIEGTEETKRAEVLELWFVRTPEIADDIAARQLARTTDPPRRVAMRLPMSALATELGDIITVTHSDGIGAGGWVKRPLFVVRHEVDPEAFEVTLEADDVGQLFGSPA